jgi:hypothetical protein
MLTPEIFICLTLPFVLALNKTGRNPRLSSGSCLMAEERINIPIIIGDGSRFLGISDTGPSWNKTSTQVP